MFSTTYPCHHKPLILNVRYFIENNTSHPKNRIANTHALMCHPIYIRDMELQEQNTPLNLGTHKSKPNSSPLSSSKMHSFIRERLVMFSKGSLKPCKDLCFHCAFPLSKNSSLALKSHLFIPQNLNSIFR